MTEPVIVAVIEKNSRETLKVSVSSYMGHILADVRVFAPVTGMDVLAPTKKGVSIRADMIGDLRKALDLAEAEARRQGWEGGA